MVDTQRILALWVIRGRCSCAYAELLEYRIENFNRVEHLATGEVLHLSFHLGLEVFCEVERFIPLAFGFFEQNLLYISRVNRLDSVLDGFNLLIEGFLVGRESQLLQDLLENHMVCKLNLGEVEVDLLRFGKVR